jgi:tetratricopeptide (TPR) repeat protein
MKRADAFAQVEKRGGKPRRRVTKETAVLIVGELGWPLLADGRPSNSLEQARSYGLPVASERKFLEWIGKAVPEEQAKTYTAAQLVALSKVPEKVLEQLAMFGLIEPQNGRYGFRDLAAARQIASLLASGVALSAITKGLAEIRKWLPDAHLANLRVFPEASDRILIEQLKGRTDKKGQFVLPMSAQDDNPDFLFEQAQAAEEANDVAMAERLYRRLMKIDPSDPAAPYNLGNLMSSEGRIVEAEAAYRAAIAAQPGYAGAWHNLADVLDEQGRTKEAVTCLERAIQHDSENPDSMFNLALFLQKLEKHSDAAKWWRQYLKHDSNSDWAMRAKRALKLCEMQLANSR